MEICYCEDKDGCNAAPAALAGSALLLAAGVVMGAMVALR